jgi:hypothetical protein
MIEGYEQRPHPAKAILIKEFGLKIINIANYLGVSYPHACNLMSGIYLTKKHDKRLNELIELCRKERGYKCEPDTGGNLTSC